MCVWLCVIDVCVCGIGVWHRCVCVCVRAHVRMCVQVRHHPRGCNTHLDGIAVLEGAGE
jgi:hypothetical protein